MVRQYLGLGATHARETLFQHTHDAAVVLLARAPQQRFVGHLLHQHMLEKIAGLRTDAAPVDQPGLDQLRQAFRQPWRVVWPHRLDQLVAEFTAYGRAQLRHFAPRGLPVQPRHQRIAQGGGNGQRRQRPLEFVAVGQLGQGTGLQQQLGDLLDKQRYTVGLHHQQAHYLGRKPFAPGEPRNHGFHVGWREAVDDELEPVGAVFPRRLELRAERHHGQHGGGRCLLDQQVQQLQRGRVGPVHVLPYHQQRPFLGHVHQPVHQVLVGKAFLPLRQRAHLALSLMHGNGQQRGEQRQRLVVVKCPALEPIVQPAALDLGRVVTQKTGLALDPVDHGMQGAVRVVRRAAKDHGGPAFVPDLLVQGAHQPALADARVAADQHHLAHVGFGLFPAVLQQQDFAVAPDQRHRLGTVRVQRGPGIEFAQHPVHVHGMGQPADLLLPQ